MKTYKRILIIFCCTVVLFSNLFMCYSTPVFAKPTLDDDGHLHVYNWDDIKDSAVDFVMYMASMAGAIFADHDFAQYVQSKEAWVNYWTEDNVVISDNGTSLTFSQDLMAFIKQCIDDYAKQEQTKEENGGFYLLPTTNFEEVPATSFRTAQQFRTFRNIIIEKGALAVRLSGVSLQFVDPFSDPDHPVLLVGDLSSLNAYSNDPEAIVKCKYFCGTCWEYHSNYYYKIFNSRDEIYETCDDGMFPDTGVSGNKNYAILNGMNLSDYTLYSTTGERVRVFVSQVAAQNYSVGSRKIYFTNNYYTYEPEDLTVAVDDLSKSVDDLQQVIDDLLDKISNDTSEKEIEELLRQILEELRKNPGTGSGESSGGGDVTVSIDLKETNSWLAKIYNRLGDVLDRMQEGFENVVEQLKKIKGWSIADTIIDGVDAVADWAQFIKDLLSDVTSGVATVSSTMTDAADLMKTKFPFCLPWDVAALITFLAHEPQTPVFQLPIIIESFGIEEYIEVDMTRFSALSTLSRTLLSLIYCYGLVNLTFKVIPMVKEEN